MGYDKSEKLSRLFRKENAFPSYQVIYDIANKFGEVDVNWLITGDGEMYRDRSSIPVRERTSEELHAELKACHEKLKYFEEFIEMQKEMIDIYRKFAEDKSTLKAKTKQ